MALSEAQLPVRVAPLPLTWRESLSDALQSRGYASATSYADAHPLVSLSVLSQWLPDSGISSMQLAILLERKLVEEADATDTMERCARSLLARGLRHELSEGWPREWTGIDPEMGNSPRHAGVFHTLTMALPDRYEPAIDRVRQTMCAANIPAGWMPEGPEDLVLLEVFGNQWVAP